MLSCAIGGVTIDIPANIDVAAMILKTMNTFILVIHRIYYFEV
jgi:hypothetical protein